MRDFRKLIVWQKAHRLTLEIHSAVCAFPLLLAHDLSALDSPTYDALDGHLDEVRRMLFAFSRAVRARIAKRRRDDSGSHEQ